MKSTYIWMFLDPLHQPLLFSLENIAKDGWLKLKDAGLIGGWSDRWVVAQNGHLFFYKTSDAFSLPAISFCLSYSTFDTPKNANKDFSFDIRSWQDDKEYNLKAKDEQERLEWVKLLRIEKVPQRLGLPKENVREIQPEFNDCLIEYLYHEDPSKIVSSLNISDNNNNGHMQLRHSISSSDISGSFQPATDSSANFVMHEEKGQIKGGTVEKLLEKLTEEQQEMDYVLCFLLTYRSFTTPQILLNFCLQRFRAPPARNTNEQNDDKNKQIHPTQLRVCTVLTKWLEVNFSDFNEDEGLCKILISFIENDLAGNSKFQNMAKKIREVIRKKVIVKKRSFSEWDNCPAIELPFAFDGNHFEVIDIPPIEVARQLTLIEFELFRKIQPKECMKVKDKEKESPNLMAVIKRFNTVSKWIATELLKVEKHKARVALLTRFIDIAQCCISMNNYNTAMEIVSALNNSAVYRLKKTWESLSYYHSNAFQTMSSLLSSELNHKLYRENLHNIQPPCLPYFGVYLTDLVFIEDGKSDKLGNGLVNFDKNYLFYKVIKEILLYQQTEYTLQVQPDIRDYLLSVDGSEDSQLYNMSLLVEPRLPE